MIDVKTPDGRAYWSAREIKAAAEPGRNYHKITPKQRDAALARLERRHRKNLKACRELGLKPLQQEVEHWKARFWDLHARLLDTPATTPRGIVAKLRGFYHDEEIVQMRAGDDPDDGLPAEWAASIYRDLERLAEEG